ncbi:MAG TPA: DUF2442 domain-containing protein [Rhizomicrobium sp.]|jgi:hypothetical protein
MNTNAIIEVGSPLPKIEKVRADTNYRLRIKFRGKAWRAVALDGLIARYRGLAPLSESAIFRKARVTDWGGAVGWPEDIGIGASTLWHMAEEQRTFTSADFCRWQDETGLSSAEAADALGLSLATIKNYRSGASIPAAVAIACRAMAAEPTTLAAHFRPRKTGRPKVAA